MMYGVLLDQITITISEEYFTKFKFIRFGIGQLHVEELTGGQLVSEVRLESPRMGAVLIGILASWWVGLLMGIVLGFIAWSFKNSKEMFALGLRLIFIVLSITIASALVGCGYAELFQLNSPPDWPFPINLYDKKSFIRVGCIHNFSYIGGGIGLLIAIFYGLRRRYKSSIK